MKKLPHKIISSVLILLLTLGFSGVRLTNAYYDDTETSNANSFTAQSLDFSLASESDFSPLVTPVINALRTIDVNNDGSLDFQYRIKTANIVGALCNSLDLTAKLDTATQYSAGTISGFNQAPIVFADPEAWDFTAHLNSADPSLQNLTCTFDLVYSGWQTDFAEGAGGYTDTETISNTITSGEWEVDSCSAPAVEITTSQTGSLFDYSVSNPNSNIIVKSGGELNSPTSGGDNGVITIITKCDLTVESGGKITAVKNDVGREGGTMTISARNFTVDVGGIVSASSIVSGKHGGAATVTTTGSFIVNGTFSANGHEDGGSITVNSGDDISISGSSLTATGASGIGKSIILSANDDITISGLVSASAVDRGGKVIILAGGDLTIPAGGSVLAESANGEGGVIEPIINGNSTIDGTLSVNAKGGNGFVVATIQGNLILGVGGLVTANSTGSDKNSGAIGIKVGGDATYSGIVRANTATIGNDGKNIALWSEGSTAINGTVSALGGTGAGDKGGVIDITTRATLSGSGALDASGTVVGSIFQRTVTNSFVGTSTPAATTESIILNDIVLNEILPNLSGIDMGNTALPLDGEWMELYNKGGIAVDVNGWVLKDAAGGILTISASKGDNNGNLSDAGETIVPAGGTLTVYRNGAGGLALNNGGDTVKLLTNTSVLIDSFTYVMNMGEDNSIARMPDGTGAWVDPEPTPTALNGVIDINKLQQEFLERLSAEVVEEEEEEIILESNPVDILVEGFGQTITELLPDYPSEITAEDDTTNKPEETTIVEEVSENTTTSTEDTVDVTENITEEAIVESKEEQAVVEEIKEEETPVTESTSEEVVTETGPKVEEVPASEPVAVIVAEVVEPTPESEPAIVEQASAPEALPAPEVQA